MAKLMHLSLRSRPALRAGNIDRADGRNLRGSPRLQGRFGEKDRNRLRPRTVDRKKSQTGMLSPYQH